MQLSRREQSFRRGEREADEAWRRRWLGKETCVDCSLAERAQSMRPPRGPVPERSAPARPAVTSSSRSHHTCLDTHSTDFLFPSSSPSGLHVLLQAAASQLSTAEYLRYGVTQIIAWMAQLVRAQVSYFRVTIFDG